MMGGYRCPWAAAIQDTQYSTQGRKWRKLRPPKTWLKAHSVKSILRIAISVYISYLWLSDPQLDTALFFTCGNSLGPSPTGA